MATTETGPGRLHPAIGELRLDADASARDAARELLLEYGRFVLAQAGAARFCFGSLEREAARLPFTYTEQGGGCLMATADGKPAGMVAWRELAAAVAPDAWEMKRLWVRPAARGFGLGRALTQAVIDRALAAERKAIYLDTVPAAMAFAHRLYVELGFTPCAPYNDNPIEDVAFMVRSLGQSVGKPAIVTPTF